MRSCAGTERNATNNEQH